MFLSWTAEVRCSFLVLLLLLLVSPLSLSLPPSSLPHVLLPSLSQDVCNTVVCCLLPSLPIFPFRPSFSLSPPPPPLSSSSSSFPSLTLSFLPLTFAFTQHIRHSLHAGYTKARFLLQPQDTRGQIIEPVVLQYKNITPNIHCTCTCRYSTHDNYIPSKSAWTLRLTLVSRIQGGYIYRPIRFQANTILVNKHLYMYFISRGRGIHVQLYIDQSEWSKHDIRE